MTPPNLVTLVHALDIVGGGGPRGITLADFGRRWPGKRRSLSGCGAFLATLAQRGLIVRSGRGPHGRFALTAIGRHVVETSIVSA
jgi:hypothetical protein